MNSNKRGFSEDWEKWQGTCFFLLHCMPNEDWPLKMEHASRKNNPVAHFCTTI